MKKVMIYILILVVGGLLSFLIYLDQTKVEPRILTIDTAYVVMDDRPSLKIPIYMMGKNHPLIYIDGIENVSLNHVTKDEKMNVELINIDYHGTESYLNQTYEIYIYDLSLPSFDQTIMMDDVKLSINLKNGTSFALSIGKVSISPSKPLEGHLDWSLLSGIKVDQSIFERVGCVEIGFYTLKHEIKGFFNGFTFSESFQIKDDTLYLYFDDEPYIYQSFPIEIMFIDGTSQMIPYFMYMKSYQLLKMSGPLIHTYDLNPSF